MDVLRALFAFSMYVSFIGLVIYIWFKATIRRKLKKEARIKYEKYK